VTSLRVISSCIVSRLRLKVLLNWLLVSVAATEFAGLSWTVIDLDLYSPKIPPGFRTDNFVNGLSSTEMRLYVRFITINLFPIK